MKYVVLTNFDNYTSDIKCSDKGIITLTLVPNNIKEISLKTNIIRKKEKTNFKSSYCTEYFRKGNEILYKYTNHLPNNNFVINNNYKIINTYIHNIPSNLDNNFHTSRIRHLKKSYVNRKLDLLNNKISLLEEKLIDYD